VLRQSKKEAIMKSYTFISLAVLLACGISFSMCDDDFHLSFDGPGMRPKISMDDSIQFYFKHHDLIIEKKHNDDQVAIDSDGSLFINDERIRTDKAQTDLAIEYYELATAAFDQAEDIGKEAVKVGLKGAEIGLKAVVGIVRMLAPDYSSEDFEKDMEKNGKKVEAKAEKVEEKAAALEKMVEEIQKIHQELWEAVPELGDLEWF
jgi:hypothetical protein